MRLKLFFLPISIVILLVSIIWFIKPGWEENKKMKKELEKQKETLESLVSKSNSLEKALYQYNQFSDETDLINNAIPEEAQSDRLVAEINDKAREAGLFLNGINLSESKVKASEVPSQIKEIDSESDEKQKSSAKDEETSLVRLEIDLDIIGDYVKARQFIESLGKTNRFIKVVSIGISRSSDEDNTNPGMVSAKINCEAFYKPEDDSIAISKLVFTGDQTMKQLLTGSIDKKVIDEFKNTRTSKVYDLIMGGNQSGKENLFIGNTANQPQQQGLTE